VAGIGDRINAAFDVANEGDKKGNADQLTKYIDLLREANTETLNAVRRNVLLGFITAASFLLFQTQTVERINFGPFEISTGSRVTIFLTSLGAYFFLEVMVKANLASQQGFAFRSAFKRWNSKVSEGDLDLLLQVDQPTYFTSSRVTPLKGNSTPFDEHYSWISIPLAIAVAIMPFVFEIYAFIEMFARYGYADWIVWLNCVITVLLLTAYAILAFSSTA
jgi:hypothetical protein